MYGLQRRGVCAGVSATALALAFLLPISDVASASSFPKPTVVSVTVTPTTLPAIGGTVRVAVRARHATTCTISLLPALHGFPKTLRCADGHLSTGIAIAKNTTTAGQTIRIRVYASGPGGKSTTKAAILSEATDVGPIGATLDVHDFSGNELAVTVTSITDPATPADEFSAAPAGDRLVAINESLTDQGPGTISDDAYSDTSVVGTNGQGYSSTFGNVVGCTDFNSGEFDLLTGASESGCLAYAIPNGVNVARVQFTLDSNTDVAQWNT